MISKDLIPASLNMHDFFGWKQNFVILVLLAMSRNYVSAKVNCEEKFGGVVGFNCNEYNCDEFNCGNSTCER